jgi:hypothetical protein
MQLFQVWTKSTWSSIVEVAVDFPAITGDHLRQPEIDDPQNLLQLIMNDKIEVVANDTADGVVALSDTWNAEVNSVFLPYDSTLNIAGKTKTTTDRAISRQSPLNRNESGRFGALKSDSTHHFFRNACTKSGSLRFSQFSGC